MQDGLHIRYAHHSLDAYVLTHNQRASTLASYSCEDALRDHPFVRDLQSAQLQALASHAQCRRLDKGDFLWRQGDLDDDLYLISSGELALEISVPHHGQVQIETIGAGEVLGRSSLAPNHRWQFDACAITAILAYQIEGKRLFELLESDHEFGYEMLKRFTPVIAQRLKTVRSRVYQLCAFATRDRSSK